MKQVSHRLKCLLGRHQVGRRFIWNAGHLFGRCRHCRTDLVMRERGWEAQPRGMRIVWRSTFEAAVEDAILLASPSPVPSDSAGNCVALPRLAAFQR